MAKIDSDQLSQCIQPSVDRIEEFILFQIVLRINPFFLKLSPYGLCNIQMWGVWRQERDEQSPLLPERYPLHNTSGFVYAGIIQYQHGFLLDGKRELLQIFYNHISINAVFRHYSHVFALSVDESQYVDFIGFFYRYMNVLSGELPAIRHVSLRTDMRFISIIEVNLSSFTQTFKLSNNLYLMMIVFLVRLAFGASPYPFISSVNTFKKRRRVLSLMDFPRLASHSALAVCRRWRWDLTAANKPALSSVFKTGLRPCPALLCKPEIPSDLKRLTQWLTLILLIPVIKPTSLELRPLAFKRMTWQRVRKQWLSPFFRPNSNAWRSVSERCGVFTRPMGTKIRNNIK